MKFISHRGNLIGPNPNKENTISYIRDALDNGYDVEIDVWYVDNIIYLGHDAPQEKLPEDFLHDDRLWFHCKNADALAYLSQTATVKYFWHQTDDYTLVSNGKIWVYPGNPLLEGSIAVVPEVSVDGNLQTCYAICTDYVLQYQQELTDANKESEHFLK
jgi:hypothetical protein